MITIINQLALFTHYRLIARTLSLKATRQAARNNKCNLAYAGRDKPLAYAPSLMLGRQPDYLITLYDYIMLCNILILHSRIAQAAILWFVTIVTTIAIATFFVTIKYLVSHR